MKLFPLLFLVGSFFFFSNLVISQNQPFPGERSQKPDASAKSQESAREKEAREFAESVFDRNMDQLFEAISTRNGNDFNIIMKSGVSGSVSGRMHVVFVQILSDLRVTKLRELLDELPEEEAAQRVRQEFEDKYREFTKGFSEWYDPGKSKWNRDSFDPEPAAHGLAATLYLSSEFCDHDQFVGKYRRWLKWYHNEGPKRFTEKENVRKKSSNWDSNSPEQYEKLRMEYLILAGFTDCLKSTGPPDRLFFINLCGLRALRRGIEPETLKEWFEELNQELEFVELPEIRFIETNRFDPATNQARSEKIVFPLIWGYGTAGILDDTVGWDSRNGEFIEKHLRVSNAAVSMATNWSRPNIIRTWTRKIMNSLTDWSSETFGWPEQKEPVDQP